MENNQEIKQFTLGEKMVTLVFTDFTENIDVDDFLKIDYGNLIAELLTYPVIVNRFGVLLADMESEVKKGEFNLSIAKSDFEETKAKIEQEVFKKLKETISSPTLPQINGATIQRDDYKDALKLYNKVKLDQIELEKNKNQINSLYWSSKAKLDIITKMTDKLSPTEFEKEIIDGKINGVMIKVRDKLIK